MKKCSRCKGKMEEKIASMPDGVPYRFYRCTRCGDEILDMAQLHEVAEKYRMLKRYQVKISKWGVSLGIRIPKDVAKKYGFDEGQEVLLIPEKKCVKLIPLGK